VAPCVPQGYADGLDGVTLDFLKAEIAVNNMGGYGPEQSYSQQGKDYIRYNGMGFDYVSETPFDLIIQNLSYYKPNKVIRNGYTFAGDFGSINLADDEECDFAYMFRETGTEDMFTVERPFEFCLFDFDAGDYDAGVGDFRLIEALEVCQENIEWSTSTEKTDGAIPTSVDFQDLGGDCYKFTASQRGYGSDNPERPDQVLRPYQSMTSFVKDFVAPKYVCLKFPPGLQQFVVTYSITPSAEPGFSGRNFLFSGNTENTLTIFYVPCYHCADSTVPAGQPEYGRPEEPPVPGMCRACGGPGSANPCYINVDPPRINSWDGEELKLFIPDYAMGCPKEIAQYCSEDNHMGDGPEGVVYPDCMGPPYNCATTCNDQADTCFPLRPRRRLRHRRRSLRLSRRRRWPRPPPRRPQA